MFKKPDAKKGGDILAGRLKAISGRGAFEATDTREQVVYKAVGRKARAIRKLTFKQATLLLPSGGRMDVVVKNVSDTGARVDFFNRIQLPSVVILAEPTLRLRRKASVVWQTDGSAGLHFLDE
jgi:hypothetical protein